MTTASRLPPKDAKFKHIAPGRYHTSGPLRLRLHRGPRQGPANEVELLHVDLITAEREFTVPEAAPGFWNAIDFVSDHGVVKRVS